MGYPADESETRFACVRNKTWPDQDRWELINGVASDMSPAPNYARRRKLGWQLTLVSSWIKDRGGPCEAFIAPADALLPRGTEDEDEDEIDCIVQPDLFVVCDPTKVGPNLPRGAPDFIVEILSPRTSRKDQNEKLRLYERAGRREYWTIDPAGHWLRDYLLPGSVYGEGTLLEERGRVESAVLSDRQGSAFSIDVDGLLAEGSASR